MRHRVAGRRLNRTSAHRVAMRRNLVASLFEHETISTTLEKAKEVKPFAEKLITLAKKGTLAARRQVIALLGNRNIIEYQDGRPVRKGTIIGKLFSDIAPRYLDKPGGYTRIIRLSLRRLGDDSSLVLLQLIGQDEKPKKKSKPKKAKKKETEVEEKDQAKKPQETQQATESEQAIEEQKIKKTEEKSESQQDEPKENTDQTQE
jgi:large subunit ribosomal protein L17